LVNLFKYDNNKRKYINSQKYKNLLNHILYLAKKMAAL